MISNCECVVPRVRLCLEARLEVVDLCRRHRMSDEQIQLALGVTARTLANYKRHIRDRQKARAVAKALIEA